MPTLIVFAVALFIDPRPALGLALLLIAYKALSWARRAP